MEKLIYHGDKATELQSKIESLTSENAWQAGEIEALAKTVQMLQAENERLISKTSPNKPLTLEQLQKMIGEPVYVVDKKRDKESGWCIVEKHYDGTIDLFKPDNTYYTYAITTGAVLVYERKIELEDISNEPLGITEVIKWKIEKYST